MAVDRQEAEALAFRGELRREFLGRHPDIRRRLRDLGLVGIVVHGVGVFLLMIGIPIKPQCNPMPPKDLT